MRRLRAPSRTFRGRISRRSYSITDRTYTARFTGPASNGARSLLPADRERLREIVRELENDPQPDGIHKFDYVMPPLAMFLYSDGRLRITYQLQTTDPDRKEWDVRLLAISGPGQVVL